MPPPSDTDARIAVLEKLAELTEKRFDRVDARFDKIDATLTAIQVDLARKATPGDIRSAVVAGVSVGVAILGVTVGILTWVQGLHLHS